MAAPRRGPLLRTVRVVNFWSHERGWVVVASSAGHDRHPAWWLNLEANPRAMVRVTGRGEGVEAPVVLLERA
jgi:deazaflavin-dependent oxidoreductase (nitroreductase family)